MAKTKVEKLPAGWRYGEYEERKAALDKLSEPVRKLLVLEWIRRAITNARRVLPIFEKQFPDDNRPRLAIEAAERIVENPTARAAAADAADAARAAADAADAARAAADAADAARAAAVAADAADAARDAARAADAAVAADAARAADVAAEWKWIYKMYQHAKGPKFLFNPQWRTDTAITLARQICNSRDFSMMPILADALQDAGMNDTELLRHLQEDTDEWGYSDWVLTNLLGII